MTFTQKIDHRFPILGKKIKLIFSRKNTTIWQDMLLCVAVALSCAFYEFENFFPEFIINPARTILTFLLIFCWLWCSFLNGFWKKYEFIIFTILFWFIPRLIIIASDNAGILDYNKYLDAAAQYSRLLVQFSLFGFSDLLDASIIFTTVSLITFCLLMFFLGKLLKKK